MITFEDFEKLDIRIGKIIACEKIENTDKLLKLQVDFGTSKGSGSSIRQIVSGIAQWYTPEDLIGKECPFLVNLEPRVFKGIESQGMLIAASKEDNAAVLLHPDKEIASGSRVK